MDAIHSLQLISRESLQEETVDDSKMIMNVPSVDNRIQRVDELRLVTNEMIRLIEMAAVPIFSVDVSSNVNGWNNRALELTGLAIEQAIGIPLIEFVVDDSDERVKNMHSLAFQGDLLPFFSCHSENSLC